MPNPDTANRTRDWRCRECGTTIHLEVGQVWELTGWRCRIQAFSKRDGWVQVREVGGDRERASYPPTAFHPERAKLVVQTPNRT